MVRVDATVNSGNTRRRYDLEYDRDRGIYVLYAVAEDGKRREVESFTEWAKADWTRTRLNTRLDETGLLLPERRR
ncbi:MAG: hypothetical protein JO247_09305 [Chloroflexi bacterium]|nr:hypothetical protein [Chloroflexota bacterium]